MAKSNNNLTINGNQVRATHSSTIRSVLYDHSDVPSVQSMGSSFYNADSWTLRTFCMEMCKWASQNKGQCPTVDQIKDWVAKANAQVGSVDRKVVIAATGDKLDRSMMLALVGGGYHEAWHTRYSKRDRLDWRVVVPNVLKRWAMISDWSVFHSELQKWNNVIEDIRIERVGIKEFPPTRHSMVELQDFVLNLEKQGLENARSHGHSGERNALSVVTGAFRDLGLGYTESSLQSEMLLSYEKDNKQAYDLVATGPLKPLLDKSINLTDSAEDQYECLWIAMDVIITLCEQSDSDDQDDDGGGTSGETTCPKCGADKSKLKIRKGNNGQYLLVCTECGHQQEVELSDGDDTGGQGGESFEMDDPCDSGDPSDQDGDQSDSDGGDQDGDPSDSDGDDQGSDKGDTDGGDNSDSGDSDGDNDSDSGKGGNNDKLPVFKVGDKAMLNGTEVVVVKASKPDANGLQDLEVEPVVS